MNNKKIAACYMRYSSHAQDDGNSIEAQDKAITKYALEHGYDLQYKYIDKAKTGRNSKRSEFQRMIADAERGLFSVCLIHKTDRFARSRYDSTTYKARLKKCGVDVISVTEDFGIGAQRVIFEGLNESFAEYYSLNLSFEVRKGLDIKASKGLHTGGIPPLGYDVGEDERLVINEAEAPIVRTIFDLYSNGCTYGDIVKELRAKDYKTKIGNEFTIGSLNSILRQRKYIGEYVYNRRASRDEMGGVNSHKNKPEELITRIPGAVPRIIDDDTFNRVQQRLDRNRRHKQGIKPNSSYLLAGLITCGICGSHYQGNTRKSGHSNNIYSSYRCGQRVNQRVGCGNSEIERNRLETFVLEQMQKYFFNDEAIKTLVALVNKYNKEQVEAQSTNIVLYQKELKNVERQIINLTNAIAKGVYDDILIEKINTLNNTKKDILQRIEDSKPKHLPEIVEADIRKAVSKFPQYMKENNQIQCRLFLHKYIESIVINKETVEVTFKVASSVFNEQYPNDYTGAILIKLLIPRPELQHRPKQRRKLPKGGILGDNYLVGYEMIT